jgi:hypothetical protein
VARLKVLGKWLRRLVWFWSEGANAMRAVAECLNRAEALRDEGRSKEALALGRAGLQLLRDPNLRRSGAAEATALISLTVLVEQLSSALGEEGATREDLVDSISAVKTTAHAVAQFPDLAKRAPAAAREWREKYLPYLEARLAARAGHV